MSGWNDDEFEGGNYLKIEHNVPVKIQILECVRFYMKDWNDGKPAKKYVEFRVTDLGDVEAGDKLLDGPTYRAAPVNLLRKELLAQGIDIADRAVELLSTDGPMPGKPAQRLVRWAVKDLGPASVAGGPPAPAPAPAPRAAAPAPAPRIRVRGR